MIEIEKGGTKERILSKEEWERESDLEKDSWIALGKQLVNELNRLNGDKTGVFKLLSKEMGEEIAKRVGLTYDDLKKYAVFHWIIGSTPEYKNTPYIDLPGRLIEKAYQEKLEELKKLNETKQ